MKCDVITEYLKKALSLIERIISKDTTLPILNSILISVEQGVVKITGTNLEIGIETSFRGATHTQGKVAIPAKILSSFITTLPKEEKITLESHSHDLTIYTGSQKTIFKGYSYEDFPPFPTIKDLYTITLKKSDIIHTLTKSLISISRNTIKPELSSVYFLLKKDILTISSTDSFRLSEEKIKPIHTSVRSTYEAFLLPLRTCEECIRLAEQSDQDEIEFHVGSGEILITFPNTTLYSRLTEGTFPEYQQIIPQKFSTNCTVSKNILISHIRRASIFTNKLQGITLELNPSKNECIVESSNRDIGEYHAGFRGDIRGDPLTVVFNYRYFLDGVECFTDDALFLGFNSETQPLLIREVKKDQSLYIVMPMKGVV